MPKDQRAASAVTEGNTFLGIELGSTRIKAVLIDADHTPVASGSYAWENQFVDHIWTYSMDDVWNGLRACYADLKRDVWERYGVTLSRTGAMGISAMMHGYLAFGETGELLVPFRTWRNTMTKEASERLTELFSFNIPQRWSIAHLYQSILNGEAHVPDIRYLTTLAGYIHWKLTGKRVLGVGDASGMFPVDTATRRFDERMLAQFDGLAAAKRYPWRIGNLLPEVLTAGERAGVLTAEGARLLDPSGELLPGVPLCPPEGDAGTGMVATNGVLPRTGNISAGTSVFAMAVLERPLSRVYPEIDLVATPVGDPVAMVHCNNCTSDIDAWIGLMKEAAELFGAQPSPDGLFSALYQKALEGDPDCGGMLVCNYLSGEHITGFAEGRPFVVRGPDSRFSLANLMRAHLYTALGALRIGMDILFRREDVRLDRITGHGGFFKTEGVGQRIVAAALHTPITVLKTAGEGGPWGMALLAAFLVGRRADESLGAYLADGVFRAADGSTAAPDAADEAGFEQFLERYRKGLAIERAAVEALPETRERG